MKILITGGAGYIGSILTPLLLNEGHEVTVLDNFMYKQIPLLDHCLNPNFEIIRGDVREVDLLKKAAANKDVLIPLACLTGAPLCKQDPVTARAVNFEAISNLLEMKSKNQMMIFPNTNSGYGVGEENIYCDEKTPLRPISFYGKWKVEIEQKLLDSGEAVTFRFATVFGMSPRMRLDLLVNDFTYRAVNDHALVLFEPHFKRNYLHIRDAAGAFLHAIQNYEKMKGEPYNVGLSDANLSKENLCQVIQKQVPSFQYCISNIGEDPDKRNYIVSNEKIEKTGYRTTVSLDEGIKELLKGFSIIKQNSFSNV